ncbi:MAG: nucleotide pyrophosphatase [Clostridia bacterium]|jgi:hypothetical protein|nr:nucleotide pyrophosphatase [Clostridia bacterium]
MKENEIIYPDYEHSILNIINTILKYYKVDTKYKILPNLEEKLSKGYKNVVLIILDGMGEHILKKISPNQFFERNKIDVVTSVCPSTTTAALTTYYSGKPPIETGWIAMSQYFKEYGRAVEMLRKIDSYTGEKINTSRMDVFDLVKYVPIYEQIENAQPRVKAYEINPGHCEARSKRNIKADNIDLLCDSIKSICNNNEKNFILGYDVNPDGLLHKYGCESEEVKEFITQAEKKIEKMCEELKNTDTLVIISADHGHKDIEKVYNILDLKEIQDCIIMPASFESRAVTFWVKDDKKEKFEKYFEDNMNDEFILFSKEEFLKRNLLGYGNKHPKVDDFIGDYIAIAIGDAIIKLETNMCKEKANKKSTHCGFTPNEMEVPLIVVDCK